MNGSGILHSRSVNVAVVLLAAMGAHLAAWALAGSADASPPQGTLAVRPETRPAADEQARTLRPADPNAGSPDAPILFCIGLHIEPLGAVPSELVGKDAKGPASRPAGPRPPFPGDGPLRPGPFGDLPPPNYNDPPFFRHHLREIKALVAVVEKHSGKLTVQAQTPFTRVAAESNETILADLEKRGHEIALHFHEDAHMGRNGGLLPPKTWAAVMKEEIDWIKKAGARQVRYWSGGNLYPGLLDAAWGAGLEVMSDHKNPRRQRTEESLLAVEPWRPAGGPQEDDVAAFARHDPNGKIVYLPDGIFGSVAHAGMRRAAEGEYRYFDFLTDGLERSLRAARKDRVNVFHVTVHPGEFRGGPPGESPYAVIDRWLTVVIDPLVKAGKVRWATFGEMADAYAKWEKANPGVDPRAGRAGASSAGTSAPTTRAAAETEPMSPRPRGYMYFAINCHDTGHVGESADTVLRLIGIFKRYGVAGDFYLTAPLTELYAKDRPDVIRGLKESGMTISYHVRPPHAGYAGFDQRLRDLDAEALRRTLRDYETYRVDPATGDLQKSSPGGYAYVAKVFGANPVTASVPTDNRRVKMAGLEVYRDLGAKMTVLYHERGTDPNQPFEWRSGLLVRPSDFSITRWALEGEPVESFWWNRLEGPRGKYFDPVTRLKGELAAWKHPRPPFVTALIHENNFARRGPEAWTSIYYSDGKKGQPRSAPFPLDAADPSSERPSEEAQKIWKAYEELVAWASANLKVVTSKDLVEMAEAARPKTGVSR